MSIRAASPDDADTLADLAHEHRIREQGWDPQYWSLAPSARQVTPMLLRVAMSDAARLFLVSEHRGRVDGYLLASEAPDPRVAGQRLWVIDDLGVASPRGWHSVAPTLLAAAAARRRGSTSSTMVIGCPHGDHDRALMLIASGFTTNCWFRTRRLGEWRAPDELDGDDASLDDGSDDLPLPHLHGLTAATAAASMVSVDQAGAMLSGSIAAPRLSGERGSFAVADPVVAGTRRLAARLVAQLETAARDRGDSTLIVACGPGEPMLDELLDESGYGRPIDWHALQW